MTFKRSLAPVRGRLLAAALAACALAAPAWALEPFAADYRATYLGFTAIGSMTLEPQGGNRWKYTLSITHPIAQMTQVTVFDESSGLWRPLTGTDASTVLVKKIRRLAVYDWANAQARWSGDVKPERAGPVALQPGDVDGLLMNLALVRDIAAGRPLHYRLVDEGRARPMTFTVDGLETITVGGQPRQATRVISVSGNRETLVWAVAGLPVPARVLQRKDGKDEIDLRIISAR